MAKSKKIKRRKEKMKSDESKKRRRRSRSEVEGIDWEEDEKIGREPGEWHGELTKDGVQELMKASTDPETSHIPSDLFVQVVAILRLTPYKSISNLAGGEFGPSREAFELVVTDGTRLGKCLLSPSLNWCVNYGLLKDLCVIHIETLHLRSSLKDMQPSSLTPAGELTVRKTSIVVKQLQVISTPRDRIVTKLKQLSRPLSWKDEPTAGEREFYVSLSNEDCLCSAITLAPPYTSPQGYQARKLSQSERKFSVRRVKHASSTLDSLIDDGWIAPLRTAEQELNKSEFLQGSIDILDAEKLAVQRLTQFNQSHDIRRRGVNMQKFVGFVTRKSALSNYSSPEHTGEYPIKFSFQVADHSHSIRVTCWNKACKLFFDHVRVGSFVLLQDARLKARRQPLGKLLPGKPIDMDDLEIAIDYAMAHTGAEDPMFDSVSHTVHYKYRGTLVERLNGDDEDDQDFIPKILVFHEPEFISSAAAVSEPQQRFVQLIEAHRAWRTSLAKEMLFFLNVQDEARKTLVIEKYCFETRYTVVGFLMFVGKRELQVYDDGRRFEYRWIRVYDPLKGESHVVQLYINCISDFYMKVKPGELVLLSRLAMIVQFHSSLSPLSVLLRSTAETEMKTEREWKSEFPDLYETFHTVRQNVQGVYVEPHWDSSTSKPTSEGMKTPVVIAGGADVEQVENAALMSAVLTNNLSQEAVISRWEENELGSVGLLQTTSVEPFSARFPPMKRESIEEILHARLSLHLGESKSFLVEAEMFQCILKRNKMSRLYEALITLVQETGSATTLRGKCVRDPLFGPVPSLSAMTVRNMAKRYFQLRLLGDEVDESNRKTFENGKRRLFWVCLHRRSFEKVTIWIRASFPLH